MWIILGLILVIMIYYIYRLERNVKPVGNFQIIQGDLMQQYKAIWTPSPTAYMVDKHQWIGKLNGGGETVLVDNIPASAGSMTYNFADNVVVEAWLRTFGDNGTTADTSHVTFTAKNLQNVAPVGNFAIAWVQNVP